MLSNTTLWESYVDQLWSDDADEAVAEYKEDWMFRVRSYCAMQHYKNASFSRCVRCNENYPLVTDGC